MQINRLKIISRVFFFSLLVGTLLTSINADEMVYEEEASDIIINSLQEKKKHIFLKKLYSRIFFMPIWMQENKLSTSAKDLFLTVQLDSTLDKNGKLYKSAFDLEAAAQNLYALPSTVAQKIVLEFKISQLY
jgi:hypothetical protein